MEKLQVKRGRGVLQYENKRYYYTSESKSSRHYICVEKNCAGRALQSIASDSVTVTKPHSCLVSSFECQLDAVRKRIKEIALSSSLPPSKVLAKAYEGETNEVLQALQSPRSSTRQIRRWRQPIGIKDPSSRSEIVLSEEDIIVDGENFLLADSNDERRILVFATKKNIEVLSLCNTIALDGTFDVVSNIYTQLFTVHGIMDDGWTFPLIYALLGDKKTSSYAYVFNAISSSGFGYPVMPEVIIMDFERAMMNAAAEAFPTAQLQGCHFHFVQSLHRNLSSELKNLFKNDTKFSLLIRKVFALAFVKEEHAQRGFSLIKSSSEYADNIGTDLGDFFAYFKHTYIGTTYTQPLYDPKFWSVHVRVLANLPRTNNSVEGWNRRLQAMAESSHLPFYRLLKLIKTEQKAAAVAFTQRLAGETPRQKKFSQVQLNRRLLNLVTSYNDRELGDFIEGVSLNMTSMTCITSRKRTVSSLETDIDDEQNEIDSFPIQVVKQEAFAPQYSTATVRKPRQDQRKQ